MRATFCLVVCLLCHSPVICQVLDKELILGKLNNAEINREVGENTETTRSATGVKVFSTVARSVVIVFTEKSQGSGVAIHEGGYFVTNWHVVEDPGEFITAVLMPEESSFDEKNILAVKLVKGDPSKDLALLKAYDPPSELVTAALASASSIQVGQDVHAIGHPRELYWSYTPGVVSQIRKNYGNDRFRATVIQTQAAISFGSSGGALFDDRGRLIGITTFTLGDMMNFAVASNEISSFLSESQQDEP